MMVEQIAPKFWSDAPNVTIELGSAAIELNQNEKNATGHGTARLYLGNRERVIITASFDLSSQPLLHVEDQGKLMLRFGEFGHAVEAICIESRATNDTCEMQLLARSGAFSFYRDRRVRLQKAVLHLLNFPAFVCLGEPRTDFIHRDGPSQRRLGRLVLNSDSWEVEIQELPQTARLTKQLKAEGGNAITHVIKVSRAGGKAFSIEALDRLINNLHRFLSFARGQWTSIFGPVGYDKKGQVVYESWGALLSTPHQSHVGWFDIHHGECLSQVYPGFLKILHDAQFGPAVSSALYWYLRSNRAGEGAGIDSGLILSQAALERLALAVLTANGAQIPRPAAEKLRHACQLLKIPIALPPISELQKAKRVGDFTDGPDAIVTIRNELVHPTRRIKSRLAPLVVPSWKLAQWYIEIFLLKLCGYGGIYSNRMSAKWVGEVEKMP
ncbi:hypothetical protein CYK37_11920 [Mesorhizobium loti]|nr:hypothetical protein [Mesorhizobium loti]PLP59177.1 hypothetical protein CYK37_11920 [Mesorhizobium loti]